MTQADLKSRIAKRIAQELEANTLVNLGVGMPTQVAEFVDPSLNILLHGENGIIGVGKECAPGEPCDAAVINSGGNPTNVLPGASFFDSQTSFGIIRGGHVDVTILGTMEVDEKGNIANYAIPGRITGMGGAMDLCVGAKKVIVATYHTAKGAPKILKECRLKLTAKNAVDTIITEMAVIDVTPEGLVLREVHPDYTVEEVQAATEATLIIPGNLRASEELAAIGQK